MSLEDRKALDEVMKDNPLWELHRRRMLDSDSALGDWRFEDVRDEAHGNLIDAIEQRNEFAASPIVQLVVLGTDAKKLFIEPTDDKPDTRSAQ